MLVINEMFPSLQGEGKTQGQPALFVRTSGCNLNCKWCDSTYTWKKGKIEKSTKLTAERLEKEIRKYNFDIVIFTGGEPMLQQDRIWRMIDWLNKVFQYRLNFEIETNGTILPNIEPLKFDFNIHFNISPKLKNSGIPLHARYVSAEFLDYPASYKFVITHPDDILEIRDLYSYLTPDKIWLMPEGIDAKTILERSQWVWEACIDYGFNFTPRLQVLTYNNRRKV